MDSLIFGGDVAFGAVVFVVAALLLAGSLYFLSEAFRKLIAKKVFEGLKLTVPSALLLGAWFVVFSWVGVSGRWEYSIEKTDIPHYPYFVSLQGELNVHGVFRGYQTSFYLNDAEGKIAWERFSNSPVSHATYSSWGDKKISRASLVYGTVLPVDDSVLSFLIELRTEEICSEFSRLYDGKQIVLGCSS